MAIEITAIGNTNERKFSYNVSLRPALNDIRITAPTGYKVSQDGGESYFAEIILKPNPGQRPPRTFRTIYVTKTDDSVNSGVIIHKLMASSEKEVELQIGNEIIKKTDSGSAAPRPPTEQYAVFLGEDIKFKTLVPVAFDVKKVTIKTKGIAKVEVNTSAPYSLSIDSKNFTEKIPLTIKTTDECYTDLFVRFMPAFEGDFPGRIHLTTTSGTGDFKDLNGKCKKPRGRVLLWVLLILLALVTSVGGYLWLFPQKPVVYFKLAGSNTIGDSLAQTLVVAYLNDNLKATDIKVDSVKGDKDIKEITAKLNSQKILIEIRAKGSKTGFIALNHGLANIAMASRQIKKAEADSFINKPTPEYLLGTGNEHVIGLDGIAVIVHPSSLVSEMSVNELNQIFSGNNPSYHLFARNSKSGTADGFKSMCHISKFGLADTFENSNALIRGVAATRNGIGFVSYAFAKRNHDVKVLPVKDTDGIQALYPNELTIKNENYILCRELYLYSLSQDPNSHIIPFINFVESAAGQKIVNDVGFVNLEIDTDHPDSRYDDPPDYTDLIKNYRKLSTEFRFKTGAATLLDARATRDIERLKDYFLLPQNRTKEIILVGFTDNVGNEARNEDLAKRRAEYVQHQLLQQGIPVQQIVKSFGAARPVHNNNNPVEKARNRRVEVWINR